MRNSTKAICIYVKLLNKLVSGNRDSSLTFFIMHAVSFRSVFPLLSALQCYINASQKERKVWKGEICPEMQAMTKMANLTIFRQRPKFRRMISRQGYQQSGEFQECGEFGKYDEFDHISPTTKMQPNELKTWVRTNWRIRGMWRILQIW